MANGLVGGVNGTTTTVTASNNKSSASLTSLLSTEESTPVTASVTDTQAYSASIQSLEAAPVEYIGAESDSMYINVDNSKRTISGEVKWRSMIATTAEQEDAYHAYPANKARINFEDISKSLETLQSNVGVLEDSCKKSTTNINKYIDDLAKIQSALTDCQKFCTALKDSLDAEVSARELDHVKLRKTDSENFNTLKTDFSKLTTQTVARMDSQDAEIKGVKDAVASEEFRAKYEEGKIAENLQTTTKLLLDTARNLETLGSETKDLINRFNSLETSEQFTSIADHTAQIEDLEEEVTSLDHRLTSQVNDATRETAKLRDIAYKHSADITNLKTEVKQSANTVEDLAVSHESLETIVENIHRTLEEDIQDREKQYLHLSTRIFDEGTIRRETDTFHEEELARLELRISMLQSELVMVIQNLADELRLRDNELASDMNSITYDFIDAGNAPI